MPAVQQPTILFLEKWNSADEAKDFSIQSYRAIITDLVDNFLTDLDDVAETLASSGQASGTLRSLNMCLEFLGENSEIFLQVNAQPVSVGDTELSPEEKSSQAFCMWFLRHLFRLLSRPDCSQLHSIIMRLIIQIPQCAKLRSKYVFRMFVLEFINIASDLINANNRLYAGEDMVEIKRFSCDISQAHLSLKNPSSSQMDQVPSEIKLEEVHITLSDPDHCELLQGNIVKILDRMLLDVCQFCASHLEVVWKCFCNHVQDGDLTLKLISIQGLCQLLHMIGLPPVRVKELFLTCVSGLWELLCSKPSPLNQSEKEELEVAASTLLNTLVKANICKIIFRQHFYRDFIGRVVSRGLSNIHTREGKQALASMLVCLLTSLHIKDLYSQINKPFLDLLTSHLIGVIEADKDFEFTTPVMVQLILLEAQQCSDNCLTSQKTQDATPTRTPGLARKRRHTGTVYPGKVKLPTFLLLQDKLNQICSTEVPTFQKMKFINLVMKVAVQCSFQLMENKSRLYSDTMLEHVIDCWKTYLASIEPNSRLKKECLESYHCMLSILGSISSLNDTYPLSGNIFQEFAWIISLPWLLNDMSWKDLKPRNSKEASDIASRITPLIGDDTKCLCLKALALLPKEIAPQWKCYIQTLVLSESSAVTTKVLIQCFPVMLLNSGFNNIHLIRLLQPLIGKETDFDMDLAEVFGKISLVMASIGTLEQSSLMESVWDDLDVKVVVNSQIDIQLIKDAGKPANVSWVTPFLTFLEHRDPGVRKAAGGSLLQVLLCVSVDTGSPFVKSLIQSALNILDDEDYDIRAQFSSIVVRLVSSNANSSLKKDIACDNMVMEFVKSLCVKAHQHSNVKLHETALMAIGQLGRVLNGQLLEECIICLLENRLNKKHLLDAIALEELQNISVYKEEPLQQIYVHYKKAICKFLVEALYTDQLNCGGINAKNIVIDIATTLGFDDVKAFLQGNEKYLLPFLVSKATPEATKLIKLLANLQFSNNIRRTLLINNTKYIFSYLVCFCQKQEMEKSLLYLQSETDFSLGNLLRLDFQRVHNELLLHLSTHYQQVFNGLKTLASNDEQYKGPKDISSTEEMAAYLEPRLLGVLAFFDSQLMNSNITLLDKELALKSVISIIRLMGSKHISSIRHKVMNTLRLGLQFKESSFVEISCKAWNCFVRSLELTLLGVMMSQIIATLLPLLQSLPKEVATIINYMIVENRQNLCKHFHEIYFLPDIVELKEAIGVLKEHGDSTSSDPDLKTSLTFSIKGISHESLDVRVHALSKLCTILRERKTELFEYIFNSESTDPVISELISALLNGCREVDSKTQIMYGKCLGHLGAVDPGRLELVAANPVQTKGTFHASIDERDFAISLINVMVKTFLAATEPRIQDCSAFALQELLQIYGISESGTNGGVDPNNEIWKGFPEQTQEILIPLLSSKYRLKVETNWSNYPHPIYGSEKGNHFKDWVSNWTGYLISKVKQVKQTKACEVFTACIATKRHNTQVALNILPHVVLRVLLDGTPGDVNEMLAEVLEVLRHMQKQEAHLDNASNFHHVSGQTIFSILDYLIAWRYHRIRVVASGNPNSKVALYEKDMDYQCVNKFLEKIPQEVLAEACYNCKAYARSLRHFEAFVNNSGNIQPHLDFMQRLYMSMDEPDGVLGVAAIRQSQPTLMQQILTHESLGQQQDAQACYERAIQMESEEISHHHGLLRSLIDLAQPNKALIHTAGILADRPRWTSQLNSYKIEAAWKLGSWDKLDEALKLERQPNTNWPVQVGRILMAYKDKKEQDFLEQLDLARKEQMGPLSAASMEIGSYHRGYENILRLHMINEIEEFFQTVVDFPSLKAKSPDLTGRISTSHLLTQWQSRLQMAQSSFRTQEPILTLRRTLLSLIESERDLSLETQIGKWWLSSTKVARKAGYLQSAYGCLLQASSYHLPEFFLEKAKWLWEKGQNDAAISCLDKGIADHLGSSSPQNIRREEWDAGQSQVFAEALLLYGKYSEETSHLETNSIVKKYKDVTDIRPEWELGYFHLAKYYDRIMNTIIDDKERSERQGEFIIYVVRNFGSSLKYGNEHIYQSMPRLLSLWLDYGTTVAEAEKNDKGKTTAKLQIQRAVLKRINDTVHQLSKHLAPYQLFTAFPQLISRICHAQPDVFQQLQEIIADLVVQYPQQAMWMMMAVSKSSYQMREKRCREIFTTAITKDKCLTKFIQDGKKLTDRLLELCEKDFGSQTTVSMSQMFKPLKRLLEDSNFSQILLPLQSSVTVRLPAASVKMNHNPFPDNQVYLQGFGDTIEVIVSLQKPKKITMIGSDGHHYVMMCKPKDDLRKDCRLMEFNAIVNKFLRRDAESRRRRLLIRTYTVTPLNEECGLVEWVNNTTGLRNILVGLYREKGVYMSGRDLKAVMPTLSSSVESKLKNFNEKLLPRHPPVFREWFMRTFPDPTSWYSARVSYARTLAVMSIVGYILGLGDRHGENILFDSTTGDCVHVDFNCLFNKGETFEWPEKVPFRLTHNMIKALGPLGYEGLFRRACEVTLKVIRDQMDPLMSVLKPFIYDPLVEWSKPSRGHKSAESGEINNELALNHVQNIEHRMKGILKTKTKPRCLPLSIEGHVNCLIQEATDEKLLCQMYLGWAAYM